MSDRASEWEYALLRGLLSPWSVDGLPVYVVCRNTAASLRLFRLARDIDVDNPLVESMEEWRTRVYCDCVAQGPRRTIPDDAAAVYTHTADIQWHWLNKPPANILKEAPCRSPRS